VFIRSITTLHALTSDKGFLEHDGEPIKEKKFAYSWKLIYGDQFIRHKNIKNCQIFKTDSMNLMHLYEFP
jgi:hypothetical protein